MEHSEGLLDGVSNSQLEIEYVEPENGRKTAEALLETARQRRCSTIVVGHKSHSWFRELVGHDLVEDLLRHGRGFAFWIVE